MKFSLIVATINRVEPLDLLFRSLCIQTYKNFEVILVDQNTKGQLDGLVNKYAEKLDIKRIFSEKGLSKARNRGLDMADGDIVCFPDDDCWYYPNTLEIVKSKFSKNQSVFGFTGRCIDDDGNESVAKFVKYRTIVTKDNVFSTAVSVTLFILRNELKFNENIGAGSGTKFGSGEESDYILFNLLKKRELVYDPEVIIGHPNVIDSPSKQRAFSYGCGMGYVLRRHKFGLYKTFMWILKPLVASLIYIFRTPPKSKFYFLTFIGRLYGYVNYKKAI